MTTKKQAQNALTKYFSKFQDKQPVRAALTGDGSSSSTCDVDGNAGWIWVRFDANQNKATKVYGPAFRGYPQDIPVLIGHKHPQDEVEQVIGFNTALYWQGLTDWILENYQTPKHGQSHGETGGDRVPVGMRNIVPGQVHQSQPASTWVEAETFRYVNIGLLITYPGEAIDLSSYDPGLGNHRYILVYIDSSSNTIGASVSSVVTLPTPPDLPTVEADWIPLAVVDLVDGAIVEDRHIYDWRVLFTSLGDLPDHKHSGSGDGGSSIIGLQELFFDAAAPLTLSGGSIYPYATYSQLFVSGMYAGGDANLSWIYPDPTYTDSAAQVIILRPSAFGLYDTYNITIQHAIGNIWLSGGQDIILTDTTDHIMLIWNGTYWCDIGGAAGGGGGCCIYSWTGRVYVPVNAAVGTGLTFSFEGIDTTGLDHLEVMVYQDGLGTLTHIALNGNDLGTFNTADGTEQWKVFSADAADVQANSNVLQLWCTGPGPSGYALGIAVIGSTSASGSITAWDVSYGTAETVGEILDETINSGMLHDITITDDGNLDISWGTSEVWDAQNDTEVDTDAGSDTCDDNAVNYLIWTVGATLTLGTTKPDPASNEIGVATISCQEGDIWYILKDDRIHVRTYEISEALEEMFPSIVTTGLIISEDADATDVWDVSLSAGTYYLGGHARHTIAAPVLSRITAMVRWYKVAGVFTSDTDAEIDPTQWIDGAGLSAVAANKYYRSHFFIVDDVIHWLYPDVEYNTLAQALEGPCPTRPPGLLHFPGSTCVILKGNAVAFPAAGSEQWVDVRPTITSSRQASTADHGSLAGLLDDDHTQYLPVDGTREMSADWEAGDNLITLADSVWRLGEVVYDLDFTGTDYDTKAECQAIGLRFSDSDTPFPAQLHFPVTGTWAHVAGNGWQYTSAVASEGPGLLLSLARAGNWELELSMILPVQSLKATDLFMGVYQEGGHTGWYARMVHYPTYYYWCAMYTNDGDDTFTARYSGATVNVAGTYVIKIRQKNGVIGVWDDQNDSWYNYGTLFGTTAYPVAYVFVQPCKYTTITNSLLYINNIKLTYLL